MAKGVPSDSALVRVALLKVARLRKGWTMMEVARRAGITVDRVKRAEEGRSTASTYTNLAEVLGIPIEELIPMPQEEPEQLVSVE